MFEPSMLLLKDMQLNYKNANSRKIDEKTVVFTGKKAYYYVSFEEGTKIKIPNFSLYQVMLGQKNDNMLFNTMFRCEIIEFINKQGLI